MNYIPDPYLDPEAFAERYTMETLQRLIEIKKAQISARQSPLQLYAVELLLSNGKPVFPRTFMRRLSDSDTCRSSACNDASLYTDLNAARRIMGHWMDQITNRDFRIVTFEERKP